MRAFTGFICFLFHNRLSTNHPRVFTFFTSLRASTSLPIACAGFCWGGRLVAQLCAASARTKDSKKPLVDCGFMTHPANEAVQQPLSITVGDVDFALEAAQARERKRVLEEGKEKGRHEVAILKGARHGFAVRGHPGVVEEVRSGLVAEDQAVAWFARWLRKGEA